jgi:hypothetical protein
LGVVVPMGYLTNETWPAVSNWYLMTNDMVYLLALTNGAASGGLLTYSRSGRTGTFGLSTDSVQAAISPLGYYVNPSAQDLVWNEEITNVLITGSLSPDATGLYTNSGMQGENLLWTRQVGSTNFRVMGTRADKWEYYYGYFIGTSSLWTARMWSQPASTRNWPASANNPLGPYDADAGTGVATGAYSIVSNSYRVGYSNASFYIRINGTNMIWFNNGGVALTVPTNIAASGFLWNSNGYLRIAP